MDEEEYMEKKIFRALKNIRNSSIFKENYNSIKNDSLNS